MDQIYLFNTACEFLHYYWQNKKKEDSKLSIRSWATDLGIKQHNHLYDMLKGRRKIPSHYIPSFIESMALNEEQARFFELLVLLGNTKNDKEIQHYQQQIDDIKKIKLFTSTAINDDNIIKDPLNFLILELTTLKNFNADPQSILDRIDLNVTIEKVEECLKQLKEKQFLTETKNNKFLKSNNQLYGSNDDNDLAVREHHRVVCQTAADKVHGLDMDLAEFQSYIYNIKKDNIPAARKIIRRFIKELLSKTEAEHFTGDETYQFSLQLFPLTEKED